MTDLTRALNSIGKQCFTDYFEKFKSCKNKHLLAEELLQENPNAISLSAQMTRINYAEWIFQSGLEYDALELIISSRRLSATTIRKAKEILKQKRAN